MLGTTLLKLTTPGVPDIYQGDELPFLALVDPDNRRPVDWEAAASALASSEPPPKLDLIRRALALRARRADAFDGSYEPFDAGEDVCAFIRGGEVLVAVAVRGELGRLPASSRRVERRPPDAAAPARRACVTARLTHAAQLP